MLKTHRELCRIESKQDACLSLQSLTEDDLFIQHKCGIIKVYKRTESEWIAFKSIDIDFCHYCRYSYMYTICTHKNDLFIFSLKNL